jgi:lsr operon transcriptional repressor
MSEKRITEESRYAGLALAEEELVARVAWCYYHDGLTQNDIGERLGLPRLKISRLLEKGRQSGVIRVRLTRAMRAAWRWKPNFSSASA